eukprot:scaffold79349_cov55-Phaeocystis_antarctica.AAC.7
MNGGGEGRRVEGGAAGSGGCVYTVGQMRLVRSMGRVPSSGCVWQKQQRRRLVGWSVHLTWAAMQRNRRAA